MNARTGGAILQGLFERFTDSARQVVVYAQEEARGLSHNYIGTEHELLGLLRIDETVTAQVLQSFDVTAGYVREAVVRIVGRGEEAMSGRIPFTPRAKKVLELALREALALGHSRVGPEHILLGLISEDEGVGRRILRERGVDGDKVREALTPLLPGPDPKVASSPTSTASVAGRGFEFRTGPSPVARRLLMAAAARALGAGREEFTTEDVLAALSQSRAAAPLLAELGIDADAVRAAIERRGAPEPPPEG